MQLISKVADIHHRVYQDDDNRIHDRMDVRYTDSLIA